jgi:hypothetical protein
LKSKDLSKIFNDEQIKKFLRLKRTLGGKFHSLQQLQNEPNLQIDCKYFTEIFLLFLCFVLVDKFFGYLLSLKSRTNDHRIHIEPRLSSKTVAVNELFTQENWIYIGYWKCV